MENIMASRKKAPSEDSSETYPSVQYYRAPRDELFKITLHEPAHRNPDVPETVIQDLWATQKFDSRSLRTVQNVSLEILDPGTQNDDQGPDFLGARIRLNGMIWAGQIEIHTSSGRWLDHRHDKDPHYNSVILHVVLQNDIWTGGIHRQDGTLIPELVLYPYLQQPLRTLLYSFFTRRDNDILCASRWHEIGPDVFDPYIRRLATERLLLKNNFQNYLSDPPASLEGQLYVSVFRALGYAKNSQAMTLLAHRIPIDLARNNHDPLDLEALYLGVAGLLPLPADLLSCDRTSADYIMDLRDRYERLQIDINITEMKKESWSYFRLRPANFPCLRIAQGAALFTPTRLFHHGTIDTLLAANQQANPVKAMRTLLSPSLSSFWNTHYRLDKRTKYRNSCIGRIRINTIIVDAVLPVLLRYAKMQDNQALTAYLLKLLSTIPAKKDDVIRRFIDMGVKPKNACDVQGLHQLYRVKCRNIRCFSCDVGEVIFKCNNGF